MSCTATTASAGARSVGAYTAICPTYTTEKTTVNSASKKTPTVMSTIARTRLTRFANSPGWRPLKNEGGSARRRAIMAASSCMEGLLDSRVNTIDRMIPISVLANAAPNSNAQMGTMSPISPDGMMRSNSTLLATAGSMPTSANTNDATTMRM